VHIQNTTLQTGKPIVLTFTDKPITAWGGLSLLAGFAKSIQLPEHLNAFLPFHQTSPNAINQSDIFMAFMNSVLTGARRFAHMEAIRHDIVIKELFGMKRSPSDLTVMRFFKQFTHGHIERFFSPLRAWQLEMMTPPGDYTLDMDSSVFERYGQQEGAVLGYNPKKHRRPSHHPIFAVLAENYALVNAWLRSGNTGSGNGAVHFLQEALGALPPGAKVKTVRADSGFDSGNLFDFLEGNHFNYAITARFTSGVKQTIYAIPNWRQIDDDISVSEAIFKAKSWSKGRRLIVIRQRNRKKDFVRGRELFNDPSYLYQGIFTSLSDLPEEVWRFYRDRANLENRIRELKWDYGIDGFCMKKFYATEAAFRTVCFTYNLMQQFQKKLGFKLKRTLGMIRTMVLSCGAELGRDGHKLILRLSVSGKRRELFENYANTIFSWEKGNCVSVESG